ncbi:hypothetical protein ACNSO7_26775 [Yersinia enterocolitica]|uniref:hypothetical protein n=1 Tax=Yersinia enterocolitica TaxID=630 RepID=UPI003AB14437
MLRTEPAALSLPGQFWAAGFHPRLSQFRLQHPVGCAAESRLNGRSRHHGGVTTVV